MSMLDYLNKNGAKKIYKDVLGLISTKLTEINSKIDSIQSNYATKEYVNSFVGINKNLLTADQCNMNNWYINPAVSSSMTITNNEYMNTIKYTTVNGWEFVRLNLPALTVGNTYTFSFDYKVYQDYTYLTDQNVDYTYCIEVSTIEKTNNTSTSGVIASYIIPNKQTDTTRGYITFTATQENMYIIINGGYIKDWLTVSFDYGKFKLEEGSNPTLWYPL